MRDRAPLPWLILLVVLEANAIGCSSPLALPVPRPPGATRPAAPTLPEGAFIAVAVDEHRSCAVHEGGDVYCWGLAFAAEPWRAVTLPARVEGVHGAIDVELASDLACALLDGGGISCWGSPTAPGTFAAPRLLPESNGATSLTLSSERVCAIRGDGGVRCWGSMHDPRGCVDELEPTSLDTYVDLPDVDDATAVGSSGGVTCVARATGPTRCFVDAATPESAVDLANLAGTRQLIVEHSAGCFAPVPSVCGVLAEGTIDCLLGFPDDVTSLVSLHDGEPAAARLLWSNRDERCLLTSDGALWCSGAVPASLFAADDVAMTSSHACALRDGAVVCWGDNEWGAIGTGAPARRAEAVPIPGLEDAVDLAVGDHHSCVLRASGELLCFGSNSQAQRGWTTTLPADATYLPRWVWNVDPISVPPAVVPSIGPAVAVFAGRYRTCASARTGQLECWGEDLIARMALATPTEIPNVSAPISVAVGDDSESCAVHENGSVICWGRGYYGTRAGVEVLALPAAARDVDGDTYRGCAALITGEVYCWGGYVAGSLLGPGQSLAPQRVEGVSDAAKVSGPCALTSGGRIVCWAWPWSTSGEVTTLAEGARAFDEPCFVRDDGSVACWINFGSQERQAGMPLEIHTVTGITDVVEVGSGEHHACARTRAGRVACWGWAESGRLGDGSATMVTTARRIGP